MELSFAKLTKWLNIDMKRKDKNTEQLILQTALRKNYEFVFFG